MKTTKVNGNPITLINGEGSVSGNLASMGSSVTHKISSEISDGKIIAVSLNKTVKDGPVRFELRSPSGTKITGENLCQGGWLENSLTFFKIVSGGTGYTITVSPYVSAGVGSYTMRVVVVNAIAQFRPCDCRAETAYAASSYLISNEPEYLSGDRECRGDTNHKYLCRGRLNANAQVRLYYEHYNNFGQSMKFGVLLWNLGSSPVTVSLISRSFAEGFSTGSIYKVWTDTLNKEKKGDDSELSGSLTLKAYNPNNPGASAQWVALETISSGANEYFNGVVTLQLTNSAGINNMGKVLCDTYIMSNAKLVKDNLTKMSLAPKVSGSDNIRGVANGATLVTTINDKIEVTPSNPYNFLITGHCIPYLQSGERLPLYMASAHNFTASTPTVEPEEYLKNGLNYGILYRIIFPKGFKSATGTVNAKVRIRSEINANAAFPDKWPGVHAIGYFDGDSTPFATTTYATRGDGTLKLNIPAPLTNDQVVLNIIIGAMSSMPAEISFCV